MNADLNYPAKILLFGEYGIILNSMALAIPYPRFSGRLRFCDHFAGQTSGVAYESNNGLKALLNFFRKNAAIYNPIHLKRFDDELENGLYFDSSIPSGFGLGSSGALTAALYERYFLDLRFHDYNKIKTDLANIESWFHGLSSGIDPLTSLLKKPVLLENQKSQIKEIDLTPFRRNYTLFLINSHSKGNTGELVRLFMDRYQHPSFKYKIDNEYLPLINQTIGVVITADFHSFDQLMASYSKFQLTFFDQMIPGQMRTYFKHGIESNDFYLKLCGSGGGGYILGIARNRLKAETYFNLNHLDYTVV